MIRFLPRPVLMGFGMTAILLSSAGCSHLEVWQMPKYVAPGSVEHKRIEERLTVLYQMTCRLPGEAGERRFIVNGERVALMVPDSGATQCRAAIPYAICEVAPGQDPTTVCTRIK